MAAYDYVCKNKHITEVVKRMGEVVQVYCPECGEPMHRKYSVTAFFIYPELSPAIREHIASVPEKREAYEGKHD